MKLLVRARNAKSGFVLGVKEAGAPITAYGHAPSLRGGPSTRDVRLRTDLRLGVVPVSRCWAWPGAWYSVACLELGGGRSGSVGSPRGPEGSTLPAKTRLAKEAKGTHAPRGKLLGCSHRARRWGITVRPEWQSSSACGDAAHRGVRGTTVWRQAGPRVGKPAGPMTQRLPRPLPPDSCFCWRHL